MNRLIYAVLLTITMWGMRPPEGIAATGDIYVVAGTGKSGFSGDGGSAMNAELRVPSTTVADGKGQLYVVDTSNNRIRLISPEGIIRSIVGNGQRIYSEDGLDALKTALLTPSSVFVDRTGIIYFSEWSGHRVRRVDPDGRIWTVAGNEQSGYVGEELNAIETSLGTPSRIFIDGQGRLYISEWSANRVRRVGRDGTINTVAGNGKADFGGDGGPATDASLRSPNGIFVTDDGILYIADLGNNRIRRVTPDGIITSVAGDGIPEWAGDGGPASIARLNRPSGVFVDARGDLYIADSRNKRIRRIDADGIISTVAGGGQTAPHSFGPATQSLLRSPSDVFVDAKGDLYITDGSISMIRRVEGIATPTTLAALRPDARVFYEHQPIGLLDVLRVFAHFGRQSGSNEFDPRLDVDPDGRISLADVPGVLAAAIGF